MGTKNISTLVKDIEDVVSRKGGWDEAVSNYFKDTVSSSMDRRFSLPEEHKATLRMSNIGTPCKRKLWYYLNTETKESTLSPSTLLKFAYGDIIENMLISLAKAAGHKVEGEQGEVVVDGIVGHRDCIIDGVTVDVKSVSTMGFSKFVKNELRIDDPFGYLAQLTGYVYGGATDPLVTDKTGGAFLVMDKQHGKLHLDYYNLEHELELFPDKVIIAKTLSSISIPPYKEFEAVPDGKSGNMKLPSACSYCDFRWKCWDGLRGFAYSNGPTFLTKVVNLPKVPEFKE